MLVLELFGVGLLCVSLSRLHVLFTMRRLTKSSPIHRKENNLFLRNNTPPPPELGSARAIRISRVMPVCCFLLGSCLLRF